MASLSVIVHVNYLTEFVVQLRSCNRTINGGDSFMQLLHYFPCPEVRGLLGFMLRFMHSSMAGSALHRLLGFMLLSYGQKCPVAPNCTPH